MSGYFQGEYHFTNTTITNFLLLLTFSKIVLEIWVYMVKKNKKVCFRYFVLYLDHGKIVESEARSIVFGFYRVDVELLNGFNISITHNNFLEIVKRIV